MAEDPNAPATGADPKPDPKPAPKPDEADLGDGGKKALDEERKARRDAERQLKEMGDKLKEIEDKDKSEVEKLRDEVASLTKQIGESDAKALRAEVAMSKGLTAAQAKRLVGTSKEELEADADEILEAFPAPGAKAPPSQQPKPDLKGGGDPTQDDDDRIDVTKLAEAVPRP